MKLGLKKIGDYHPISFQVHIIFPFPFHYVLSDMTRESVYIETSSFGFEPVEKTGGGSSMIG